MLLILRDPAGITGGDRHALDYSVSLQDNIARHLSGGADCELLINGVKVDPLTDPRLDVPPSPGDLVTVLHRPAGTVDLWLALISVALAAYSYASIPKLPPTVSAKESPNNQLTGQTNIARAYQAIPDVYGRRRVWPDLIQPSVEEYIENVKFVTEWLCVSRGAGTISAVCYADTPIDDIDGATWEAFQPTGADPMPEFNSTTLTNVIEPFPSPEVNGQEVRFDVESPIGIERTIANPEELGLDGGGYYFVLDMADDAALDDLKAAAPGGAVFVQLFVGGSPAFQRECTIDSYTAVGSTLGVLIKFYVPGATSNADLPPPLAFEPARFVLLGTGIVSGTTVGPFTLRVANADRLRWNLAMPRGLKGTVRIRAEWWKVDGAGVEVGGSRQFDDYDYTGNTYDQQNYTETVTPTAGTGRYQIQFTRLSADLENGADVVKLEQLAALRYYATKTLPGVTVVRVTTRATQQATGFSERKFNLYFERHVRTLTSTAVSASRNFGRILAHVWSLAGEDIAEFDTTTLAAINTEFGETSPLLRFDGSFDDADMSLGERMQRIANNGRCTLWRDGTKWTVTRDQARSQVEVQLDYRNLAASGDSSISYAAHLPASNDGVEVEYVDETTQAKKAYIRLNISTGAVVAGVSSNPVKIKMPGCATQSQADNRAQLEARRLLYQRTSVQDTALADGGQLGIGSLVRWVDPNDFFGDDGLQAGEVRARSSAIITTSEMLNWNGESSGRIAFTGTDGLYLGAAVQCVPVVGEPYQVELSSVPGYLSGIFLADDTRQLGSRYVFGPGITEAEIEAAGLFLVTEINPGADGTIGVGLAVYDERMYEED